MKYSGNLPTTNVNVTETSPLKELLILVTGLFLIFFIVYSLLGLGIDFAVESLTPKQEKKLSFNVGHEFFSMDRDEKKSAFLQNIINALQAKCVDLPYKIKIFVVDNDDVNAIALPGGTILVFSGLLEKVRSENELTFILAHELGHFKNRDHLRGMGRAIVLIVLYALVFGGNSGVDEFLSPFMAYSESSHSRGQESMADSLALDAVQCHYGHVGGATGFFEGLLKEDEPSAFGHFLASHPEHTQRITDINNQINKSGYKEGEILMLEKMLQTQGG